MSQIALIVVLAAVVIEIPLSFAVAWLGGWWTLLSAPIAFAVLGVVVVGYAAWRYGARFAEQFNSDAMHDDLLARSMMLVLAGFLLFIPTLQSNIVGLTLLLPSVRGLLIRRIRHRIEAVASESKCPMPTLLNFEEARMRSIRKAA
jgi:UPF0716 protein FxsA